MTILGFFELGQEYQTPENKERMTQVYSCKTELDVIKAIFTLSGFTISRWQETQEEFGVIGETQYGPIKILFDSGKYTIDWSAIKFNKMEPELICFNGVAAGSKIKAAECLSDFFELIQRHEKKEVETTVSDAAKEQTPQLQFPSIKFQAWKGKCLVCPGPVIVTMCPYENHWQYDKALCLYCKNRYSVDFEGQSEKEWIFRQYQEKSELD